MTKSYMAAALGVSMIATLVISPIAFAQTTIMPVLYDQAGNSVNSGAGTLAAGTYYLGGGLSQGGHQVQYYGNGTYYDPTTQTYGGSVSDQSGMAGVALNYGVTRPVTPGVPNTGAGGGATTTWVILASAGAVVLLSAVYLGRRTFMV